MDGIIEWDDNVVGYKKDLLKYTRNTLSDMLKDDSIELDEIQTILEMAIDLRDSNENENSLIMIYDNPMAGASWKCVQIEDAD